MTPPPPFTFANDGHDRHSELRDDTARLAEIWADPATRVLVVGKEHVATAGDDVRWLRTDEAPEGERLYLGEADSMHSFAVMVDHVPDDLEPESLRIAGARMTAAGNDIDAGLAVHAVGIANWHSTHGRCARCGHATDIAQAGHVRRCPECGATHFPRTDPAVIMLVTDGDERALLGRQAVWPEGRFSTLAGFVEPGESLEDAVRREIHEESGIDVGTVTYAGSQPWPFPSSLMLGFFAEAASFDIAVDGVELEDARWFTREQVTEMTAREQIALPTSISISRYLIDTWHGGTITGAWT